MMDSRHHWGKCHVWISFTSTEKILKAQYYFEVEDTLAMDRIKIVAFHLDDRAMRWHQRLMKTKGYVVLVRKTKDHTNRIA